MSTSTAPPGADNDDKMATATVKRKATDATKNSTVQYRYTGYRYTPGTDAGTPSFSPGWEL
jgi:hypothetical protein